MLIAGLGALAEAPMLVPALPAGLVCRPATRDDIAALGVLYFEAYPSGTAATSLDDAVADIRAAFDGLYGELWPAASPIVDSPGGPVAAIQVVRRAPWPDASDCPFVIELFSHPRRRRCGLGRALLAASWSALLDAGETCVALRVDDTNIAAITLYRQFGFVRA